MLRHVCPSRSDQINYDYLYSVRFEAWQIVVRMSTKANFGFKYTLRSARISSRTRSTDRTAVVSSAHSGFIFGVREVCKPSRDASTSGEIVSSSERTPFETRWSTLLSESVPRRFEPCLIGRHASREANGCRYRSYERDRVNHDDRYFPRRTSGCDDSH